MNTIHRAAAPLNLDTHLADHSRETTAMDDITALYTALAWYFRGETTLGSAALGRLDDDALTEAAWVGTLLARGAEQVLAKRTEPVAAEPAADPDWPFEATADEADRILHAVAARRAL